MLGKDFTVRITVLKKFCSLPEDPPELFLLGEIFRSFQLKGELFAVYSFLYPEWSQGPNLIGKAGYNFYIARCLGGGNPLKGQPFRINADLAYQLFCCLYSMYGLRITILVMTFTYVSPANQDSVHPLDEGIQNK